MLTFSEFIRKYRGWQRRQKQAQDRQLDEWRRTRWLGTILLNVHRDPDSEPLTPEEVLPLLGDSPPEAPAVMSLEEFEHIASLYS